MTAGKTRRPPAVAAALLSAVGAALLSAPVAHAEELAPLGRYDYAPYQVAVSVTFASDPVATRAFREDVVSTLGCRISQTFGAAWNVVSMGAPRGDDWLAPADETGLSRLTYAEAAARLKNIPCEKAYFLVVCLRGLNWTVAGREWDKTLQSLGPISTSATLDRRGVAGSALGLIERLFSPLLIVEDADKQTQKANLTVRAGSIPYGDAHFAPIQPGSLFVPVFRFLDSKRNVRKIQPLPWSYLVLDAIERGHATGTVVSSFRAPLAANMRRRVEAVAVLVRPELHQTELKLLAGRGAKQPLAGVFVSVEPLAAAPTPGAAPSASAAKGEPEPQAPDKNKESAKGKAKTHPSSGSAGNKKTPEDGSAQKTPIGKTPVAKKPEPHSAEAKASKVEVIRLLTDRRGIVEIPVDPQHPLRRLQVYSGTATLARRPFVPGIDAEVTLELADDTIRLDAERDVDLLRGRLIETVARRAAFIGRTRAAMKKGDAPAANQLMADLLKVPGSEAFLSQLNQIRVIALEDAARQKDKIAERRINDLCQRTRQLIEQYLPDDRIATFKEEISDLLKEQTAARAAPPKRPTTEPLFKERPRSARAKKGMATPIRPSDRTTTSEPSAQTNSPEAEQAEPKPAATPRPARTPGGGF